LDFGLPILDQGGERIQTKFSVLFFVSCSRNLKSKSGPADENPKLEGSAEHAGQDRQEVFSGICYKGHCMNHPAKRKQMTSRIIRPGDPVPDEQYWDTATPEERMNAVWDLTLLCLAWQPNRGHEPRLQGSISRIQRPTS
jgi:hypothetical protein